jgi:hypothetical protein
MQGQAARCHGSLPATSGKVGGLAGADSRGYGGGERDLENAGVPLHLRGSAALHLGPLCRQRSSSSRLFRQAL